jgi:hypothetical protein
MNERQTGVRPGRQVADPVDQDFALISLEQSVDQA